MFGALKAGLVVVNTNPLYTETEMEHQFKDSGVKALVVLANAAYKVEGILAGTSIQHIIVSEIGDMFTPLKRMFVNGMVKHIQGMVPEYNLPDAIAFNDVLAKEMVGSTGDWCKAEKDDTAVLQYTGGTTGVAKGAELTHGNLLANMMQIFTMAERDVVEGKELMIAPLPLYHTYSFTVHCMVGLMAGSHSVLITSPRDIKAFVKELKSYPFTILVGLNTLFNGLLNHPGFRKLDFTHLKMTMSGGMALQMETAKRWEELTGCAIYEAYGLTEASPGVTFNTMRHNRLGTVGKPLPSTKLKIIDDDGFERPPGKAGELLVKGPQVMKGYWNRPEETEKVLDGDGWLKTGDIAVLEDSGYVRIVDRKKDTIIVSGFKVYPNELEDILVRHPDVEQCAAIGIPCRETGERIKMFVVSTSPSLTPGDIRKHFREYVVGYKVPKVVVFRDSLPLSNVGKVLRRVLRNDELARLALQAEFSGPRDNAAA